MHKCGCVRDSTCILVVLSHTFVCRTVTINTRRLDAESNGSTQCRNLKGLRLLVS